MKEPAPSLLWLIGVRMLTVTLVWLALMIVFVQSEVDRNARELRARALESVARALAAELAVDSDAKLHLKLPPSAQPAGYDFVVRGPDLRTLASAGGTALSFPIPTRSSVATLIDPQLAQPQPRDIDTLTMLLPEGRTGLGLVLWVDTKIGLASVLVAEDLTHPTLLLDDLVNQFFVRVGWILVPGVGLLLFVSLLTIRAELRPIEHVAAVAETIGPYSTGVRLPDRFIPREVMPLIETVNAALDRIDRTVSAQREFTADAAHELKTPLAVMRAQLEAMPHDDATNSLRKDVETMARLVAQLLRLAEADQLAVPPGAHADLAAIARDVTASIAPLALAQQRSISLAGGELEVPVKGLAGPLTQAVRNLVENALRHTPQGSTVAVGVGADRSLSVRDHGPGIPDVDRQHLFQRFWRKGRSADGAGLGLAIVAKIVEAHGGQIEIDDAPGGGALFRLRFQPMSAATD